MSLLSPLAALLAPFPLMASSPLLGDPCAIQYKAPSYDRRVFAEVGSGFRVPQDRPLPYVVTPRIVLLRPLDAKFRWSLSGSIAARFGDTESNGTLGARLHRSIASGTSTIKPGLAIGVGPDLVLAHDGGLEAAAEITVDLTPLMIGARGSWGPITLNHDAFSRPARLETFIGWRIFGWRRESTPLEELLHQPPPPRRRFRPQLETAWFQDFEDGIRHLPDTLAYLSLVQQLVIRLGAQFDHSLPDCGQQHNRLKDAKAALGKALRQKPDSVKDVRTQGRLAGLLREQSEGFANALNESVEHASRAEDYQPDPLVLGPAVLHAMSCVLDGSLSPSCIRVQK